MSKANIPVFVSHKGCPNDCIFCNQKRITGKSGSVTAKDVEKIVTEWLSYVKGEAEIAFFGGSFTGIDMALQKELLGAAKKFVDGEKITGIRLSTRPDYINEEIIEHLLSFGVTTVELGAQSTDADVLKIARRGHRAEDIIKASRLIKESGMTLGLQMMTHLPGSTYEKDVKTCLDFISMAPSEARIYPTLVLKDTYLCDMYEKGEYTPATVEEAVDITAHLTELFDEAKIRVIRTGLQPSDSLTEGFVAGPFHPAFGEMAQSRLILNRVLRYIEEEDPGQLVIYCEEKYKSRLYGQRRSNMHKIERRMDGMVTVFDSPVGSGIRLWKIKIYD